MMAAETRLDLAVFIAWLDDLCMSNGAHPFNENMEDKIHAELHGLISEAVAGEREACAQILDPYMRLHRHIAAPIADAIRARGKTE